MQSFRTEIENNVVEQDIIDLERKIRLFKEGKIVEEKFRSLRLARGIYGQRQEGVQMIRIKLPFGRVTSSQLKRIAEVSDEYSTGKLHITTRQDIQIHYVSIDRTPQLWTDLDKDDVTIREACGNTVRNITASDMAGIDPDEPFDVTPYADAMFRYLLRNPICQEMGRKFKIAFSSSDKDSALTYLHDLGFMPQLKTDNGVEKRGFKVLLGGGLGSQPKHADLIYDFLDADQIIPFTEAVIRIFDRYGERNKRMKARMKFLVKEAGLQTFLRWVEAEKKALPYAAYPIAIDDDENLVKESLKTAPQIDISGDKAFEHWKKTNVLPQKQKGKVAVGVRVLLGNFSTSQARALADLIHNYAADELRFTLRQNLLIRHVDETAVPFFYQTLEKIGLAAPGYESTADITACPGTDTCNLGIASSTGIAEVLEQVITEEYPQYLNHKNLLIKISGCMNACGQHNMAQIGFQGMSIRQGKNVAPALQVLLGGGTLGNGEGRFSDKVIKIPSKRGPQALRVLLDDYEAKQRGNEDYISYYDRQGKNYFYELLKPLSETDNLQPEDFVDWGHDQAYVQAIGVGECAGVVIDLIATLLLESQEKAEAATACFEKGKFADSIYFSYATFLNAAKALLLAEGVETNSQASVISLFDIHFVETKKLPLRTRFEDLVYQIKENAPDSVFAEKYLQQANTFLKSAENFRQSQAYEATA
ncbi:MAG: nitrite/sulfite reductase [Flavobacteriaceae bacterium]|nr:nitrite/sulfite reductase [Flavobacteriaceae bacterium]